MNEGYKIVIDASNGGTDPGVIKNGIVEKEYTLKIALYMKKRFDELGIKANLTRTSDETLSPDERIKKIKRFYGDNNDVIVISNSLNSGDNDGLEVIYSIKNNDSLAKLIANEIGKEGQNISKVYQKRLPSEPSKDYDYILRELSKAQPVLIKYGFVNNKSADESQLKNNWQDYAEAVVRAVTNYTDNSYSAPVGDIGAEYYIIGKGDTLFNIAKKYNTTANEIKALNNLNSNMIVIGQKLRISKEPNVVHPINSGLVHTIKKGDTLYNLAQKYNVSIHDIINSNNLSSTNLAVGKQIKIPAETTILSEVIPTKTELRHIVQKGESLYSIANTYNLTIDDIKNYNSLSTDIISINQILLIPIMR